MLYKDSLVSLREHKNVVCRWIWHLYAKIWVFIENKKNSAYIIIDLLKNKTHKKKKEKLKFIDKSYLLPYKLRQNVCVCCFITVTLLWRRLGKWKKNCKKKVGEKMCYVICIYTFIAPLLLWTPSHKYQKGSKRKTHT